MTRVIHCMYLHRYFVLYIVYTYIGTSETRYIYIMYNIHILYYTYIPI